MTTQRNEREARNRVVNKRVGRNVFQKSPRVSVVIPAYNSAAYIREALESVVGQKYREHEIIVVNDGSPDTEAFEGAMGPRIEDVTYIRQRSSGAGVARNTGINHARGEIIAFLDADDVWLPEFLASQLVYLERQKLAMVYCDAYLFGMQSAYRRTFMETAPSVGEADFESILDMRCNVITSGTMVRKQAVIDAGMFETERVRAHDFHLWLRIAKQGGKIGYQRLPLVKYRVSMDGLSGDSVERVEREINAYERVRKSIDMTPAQHEIIDRRVTGLEADLAVEQGKSYLLNGEFRAAAIAFRVANRHRRSFKLAAITAMARIAPKTLLKYYLSNRAAEIAFVPKNG